MAIRRNDNQLGGAQNLGSLAGALTRKDSIGQKDKLDYFKFTLLQTSNLSLVLKRSSANANAKLELRNSAGALLIRSQKTGKKVEAITTSNLAAGIYYIGVKRLRGDTQYTLTTLASSVPPPIPTPTPTPTPIPPPTPTPTPTPIPPPTPTPTPIRSSDLGILSGTSSLSNSVGKTSDPSFTKYRYRFELSQIILYSAKNWTFLND
jgi:hypothetical protein